MVGNQKLDRRNVLQMAGLTLAGIVGTAGTASGRPDHAGEQGPLEHAGKQGPPEHARATGWLRKEGDRVTLDITEEEYKHITAPIAEGVPETARRVPFEVLELQAQAINEAIEANKIELPDNGEVLRLNWTEEADFKKRGIGNDV